MLSFVQNCYMDSVAYKAKQGVSPFIQSLGEEEGWILIEFWGGDKEAIEKYVGLLTTHKNHLG